MGGHRKSHSLDESCEIDNDTPPKCEPVSLALAAADDELDGDVAVTECLAIQQAMRESQEMVLGHSWYLLSFKWWSIWKNYAMYDDEVTDAASVTTTSGGVTANPSSNGTGTSPANGNSSGKQLLTSGNLDKSIEAACVERPPSIDNSDLLDRKCVAKYSPKPLDLTDATSSTATIPDTDASKADNDNNNNNDNDTTTNNNHVKTTNNDAASDSKSSSSPTSTTEADTSSSTVDDTSSGIGYTLLNDILAKQQLDRMNRLKAELVPGIHYTLVPERVWNLLVSWYGVNYTFCRKVISTGISNALQVEVYPLRMICKMLSPDNLPQFEYVLPQHVLCKQNNDRSID
jgi:hypothetical protein